MISVKTIDGLTFSLSPDSIMAIMPVMDGPPAMGPDGKPDPRLIGGARTVVGQSTILTVATPPLTVAATQDEIGQWILEDRVNTQIEIHRALADRGLLNNGGA